MHKEEQHAVCFWYFTSLCSVSIHFCYCYSI